MGLPALGEAGASMRLLPAGVRQLIRLAQCLNFGRIVGLAVRDGGPDFTRAYRTVQTVKLGAADNGARPEAATTDFELRKEHTRLFGRMADLPDGATLTVEVKHGLPFIIEIEQEHRA